MNVEIISSNPTKNGNFCTKMQNKSTVTVEDEFLGKVTQERTNTYYVFTEGQLEAGKKGQINLDNFDLVHKDFTAIDSETQEEINVQLKYLYPKA